MARPALLPGLLMSWGCLSTYGRGRLPSEAEEAQNCKDNHDKSYDVDYAVH